MSRSDRAVVFDVQRFCLHDGPGIRTVVFFKGCALDCAWCHNPEAVRAAPELSYRGERCMEGCRDCLASCPEHAIQDRRDTRIEWSRCTHCGLCAEACPVEALAMVGRERTAGDLLAEVLRDRPFHEQGGGGVTFSGGEPALHSAFLSRFLPMAKAKGLHLALETAGACPWSLLEPLLPWLDLVLFDLKVQDPSVHARWTGSGNAGIHENLARLVESGANVEVRMPVVPGVNTTDTEVEAVAALLGRLGLRSLALLPYNHLWESKLPGLATSRTPLGIRPPGPAFHAGLRGRFESHGIRVRD